MSYKALNNETREIEEIQPQDIESAIISGKYSFNKNDLFNVVDKEGKSKKVNALDAYNSISDGNIILSDDEIKQNEIKAKYGHSQGTAAVLGAAKGLSLGISDLALTKTGLVDEETLKGIYGENPKSAFAGEVIGSLVGLGKAKAVTTPLSLVTRAAESLGSRVAGKIGVEASKAAVKKAVVRGATVGAIEGVAGSATESISQYAQGNKELSAEKVIANGVIGGVLGGTIGSSIGAVFGRKTEQAAINKTLYQLNTKSVEDEVNVLIEDALRKDTKEGTISKKILQSITGLTDEEAELFLKDFGVDDFPAEIAKATNREKLEWLKDSGLEKIASGIPTTAKENRVIALYANEIEEKHMAKLEQVINKDFKDIKNSVVGYFYEIAMPMIQFSEQNFDAIKRGAFAEAQVLARDVLGGVCASLKDTPAGRFLYTDLNRITTKFKNKVATFKANNVGFPKNTDPTDLFTYVHDAEKEIDLLLKQFEGGEGLAGQIASKSTIKGNPELAQAIDLIKGARKELDTYTKNANIWGKFAETTSEIQSSYTRWKRAEEKFNDLFLDKKYGMIHKDKLRAILSSNPKNTSKYPQQFIEEGKQVFDEFFDSFKNLSDTMVNIENKHGIDALNVESLTKLLGRVEKDPSTYQDLIYKIQNKLENMKIELAGSPKFNSSSMLDVLKKSEDEIGKIKKVSDISDAFNKILDRGKQRKDMIGYGIATAGATVTGFLPFIASAPIGMGIFARMNPYHAFKLITQLERYLEKIANRIPYSKRKKAAESLISGIESAPSAITNKATRITPFFVGKEYTDESYEEKKDQIIKTLSDEDTFIKNLNTKLAQLDDDEKVIASQKAVNALAYLKDKALDIGYDKNIDAFTNNKYKADKTIINEFFKQYEAVNDPAKVIYNISNGFVDSVQIGAIKKVYPEIFNELKYNVLKIINDKQENIPYSTREMISNIFDVQVSGEGNHQLQQRLIRNSKIMTQQESQTKQNIRTDSAKGYFTEQQKAVNRRVIK